MLIKAQSRQNLNFLCILSAKSFPQGFSECSIDPVLDEEHEEVEGGEGKLADDGHHPLKVQDIQVYLTPRRLTSVCSQLLF